MCHGSRKVLMYRIVDVFVPPGKSLRPTVLARNPSTGHLCVGEIRGGISQGDVDLISQLERRKSASC